MRIVHLNFSFETGGIETMLVDIMNEQCAHTDLHLVVVNAQVDARLLGTLHPRIRVWRIDRPKGSRNPLYLLRLTALLHRLRPDVVHCHNHQLARLLRGSPGRHCLTIHDVRVPTRYLGRYCKLFAISEVVRQDIRQRAGLDAERVANGIPVRAIRPRTEYRLANPFRVVQISRLQHEKKGQHLLLDALRQLVYHDNRTDLRVEFVGDGASRAYLQQLVQTWQLGDYVTFAGTKTRTGLYQELKNYHLLVQPSLYEGFGLTVVEGMVAGVPVLVSDIDGPMELIDNEQFGYSFRADDAAHLAEQIRRILLNYESADAQCRTANARQYARTHYDVRQTATSYLTCYQQLS